MRRMEIEEFRDRLWSGRLSRRQALGVLAGLGVVPTVARLGVAPARAAQPPLVLEWTGNDNPSLYPSYFAKYGKPRFSFFDTEQQMAAKLDNGLAADITHPCADSLRMIDDAGLLKPIDPGRLSNWPDMFKSLRDSSLIRDDNGNVKMMPADWGSASILYRTDLYEGEQSWCMLFDERYAGKLSSYDSASSVLVAGLCKGYGAKAFHMTDAMLAKVRPLVEKQARLVRFYWNDMAQVVSAMASGEIVAAYAWNGAVKALKAEGVPVAFARPKEGILTWLCGLSITNLGQADEELVYAFLDAWLSPQAGKFLIETYGYGHANRKAFKIADPRSVADLGFPPDPTQMLNGGIMFQPYDPIVLQKMVKMFDSIKASR